MKFNIDDYKGKYVMHCKTEEEASDFCEYMAELDYLFVCSLWCYSGDNVIFFNESGWGHKKDAIRDGYTILEWSDFMNKEFTKEDLKTGDVILKRNGDVEIVIKELGVFLKQKEWNPLDYIEKDLTHSFLSEGDIVAVRRPCYPSDCQFSAFKEERGTLVYERKEVEEMTLAEVCKLLGKEIKIVK